MTQDQPRRTSDATLADVGEFGLISAITAIANAPGAHTDAVLLGPGDDAAILRAPDGRVVASTDMLVQGRHFRVDWSSAYEIGRKAAAQNLADIAAMGARPTALLVAFAAPATTQVQWAVDLTAGMVEECSRVGAALVGGDITASDQIIISVTALGDLQGRQAVTRSGARPGDLVAIAGRIGWAAAGLALLARGFRSPRVLVDAHRVPAPAYEAGPVAAAHGATAMIDVSDGLVADVRHIAESSGVRISIETSRLIIDEPVRNAAAAYNVDPLQWLLTGGDDHALVATFPGPDVPEGFAVIGTVEAGEPGVQVDGRVWTSSGGHDHFSS